MTAGPPRSRLERVRAALRAEYEVLRPLGEGGMGTVYLARQRALDRLVALKVLDPDLGVSPIFRSRFEREAQTAAQLQHPNIVPVYGTGFADGLAYFSMGYVAGDSLGERMRGVGRMPVPAALRYAREIAAALGAAHRRGVIHRDVKPQNVLLDAETGRAMVTDFGIASVSGAADRAGPDGEPLTRQGMVMGTPRYMSPEQATGERDLTPASDLYALGVILYEMLTGEYPYKVGAPPNFMLAHLTQPVIPPVARVGDMPQDVERLVLRLLAKDPADRYGSAEEVIAAIDALGGTPTSTPARGLRRWSGRRRLAAALGVVLVAAVSVFARARHGADAGAAADPRRSVLVGFFQNDTPDRSLDWLRVGGVEYLGQALAQWKDLHVVGAEQLLDLARRERLVAPAPLSQEDALRLGRRARVGTVTIGSILRFGEKVRLTVRVYDVRSGSLLRTASAETVPDSTLPAAFGTLATQILDLAGAPATAREAANPPTASLAAYREYVDGIAARSRWDLAAAEASFRRAVRADSTFALAWYELSQARFAYATGLADTSYAALADTAAAWAEARPARERLLIHGYRAMMRADLPRARELFERLLAIDSTVPDALIGLADVQLLDRTLRPNGRGGWVVPMNLTAAFRHYGRALELNASDHRIYANLAQMLSAAALGEDAGIPVYREAPERQVFPALFLRSPAKVYAPLLVRDSFVLVLSDSLAMRYPRAVIDSLRAAARVRTLELLRQWTAVAPAEGQPYAIESSLRAVDHDIDGALAALATAERLGAAMTVPYPVIRLVYLLEGQRLPQAVALADSLRRAPATPGMQAPTAQIPVLSALVAAGRLQEASAMGRTVVQSLRQAGASSDLQRRFDLSDITIALRIAAITGQATSATVREAVRKIEQVAGTVPDSDRAQIRHSASRAVIFAAATVGDTALLREWNRYSGFDYSPELAALAAVNAGDTPRAARLLAAIARDTTHLPTPIYARAHVLLALGRREQALATYARLDSADYNAGPVVNTDWILRGRSLAERAVVQEALGDTASARKNYAAFIALWQRADPTFAAERDRAARALAELDRADRTDRRPP